MFADISSGLRRLSRGWVALAALLVFVAFMILVLPAQSKEAESINGGKASPDTSFLYSRDALYQMAKSYGEQGRQAYIHARFTFDLIFPVVYGFFLVTGISWLFAHSLAPASRWQWLNLTPVLGMLFDYLENISASLVFARYPQPTPVIDSLAPIFSAIKWLFVYGSFGVLLVAVAAWLWNRKQK